MKILIEEEAVTIQLSGWNRLRAARVCGNIRLDLSLIKGVRLRPVEASKCCKGFRLPPATLNIPWEFKSGTFYHLKRKPDFYFFCDPDRTVAIELAKAAKYSMVVVEVGRDETPEEVAARIQEAVKLAGPAGATASNGTATATVRSGAAKAAAGSPELRAPLLEV
ncbi:hypothetical protein N2152v2_002166 [Parachlorella kessleri]